MLVRKITTCESKLKEVSPISVSNNCPWIMGILNVTPDSFSDGGEYLSPDSAIGALGELISAGASIVDIGGESTGPNRVAVSPEDEWRRIEPVLSAVNNRVLISVDTYKASVADRALYLGARLINDVSALRADRDMAAVVKNHQAFVVLMYSKQPGSSPHCLPENKHYGDLLDCIYRFLSERIEFAIGSGISSNRIIIDPGMGGFISSLPEYSWQLLRELELLVDKFRDFPMLVGTSRKGFLGGELGGRDPISQLTALDAYNKGARIIRTHNPAQAVSFCQSWHILNAE